MKGGGGRKGGREGGREREEGRERGREGEVKGGGGRKEGKDIHREKKASLSPGSSVSGASSGSNVLSLSSSGPYSIVQLEILQQLEVHAGRNLTSLFQWIIASGFGALFLLFILYGTFLHTLYVYISLLCVVTPCACAAGVK